MLRKQLDARPAASCEHFRVPPLHVNPSRVRPDARKRPSAAARTRPCPTPLARDLAQLASRRLAVTVQD
ncbi:predicted protein [Streptomyces sp. AA4]|nr:predicted protein [Streptomyces sp. AA4]